MTTVVRQSELGAANLKSVNNAKSLMLEERHCRAGEKVQSRSLAALPEGHNLIS